MTRTLASGLFVARALARSWLHRPVRVLAAVAGGIAGVLLTTAVLTIAVPIIGTLRIPPIDGLRPGVVAVSARASGGIADGLATRLASETGATRASRLLFANTTIRPSGGELDPIVVLGVDAELQFLLDDSVLASAEGLAPLGPQQAYVGADWADGHGVAVGSSVEVTTPTGVVAWQIADVIDGAVANQGAAVLVAGPELAAAFGRGASADVVLLDAGAERAAVSERAVAVVDGAADVSAPDDIFASFGRVYQTPLMLVSMFAVIAVLTGGVVLLLAWRLALADIAPILAKLRLVGVRPRDLVVGSGLVLLPILALTYVVGAVAGVALGSTLSTFRTQIANFTGRAFATDISLPLPLLGAFVAAAGMFAVAWLTGLWQLLRISAADAILGRTNVTPASRRTPLALAVGAVALVLAAAIVWLTSGALRLLAALPLLAGLGILSSLLPVAVGGLARRSTTGPTGLLVGRQLEVQWRRNAALSITFAVALLTSITMAGVSGSIRGDIEASNARWTTGGDLYVQAAPLGQNLGSETFPATMRDEVAAVPGVARTLTFAYSTAVLNGGRYVIESVAGEREAFTTVKVREGPPGTVEGTRSVFDHLVGDQAIISANFGRTQDLSVGSTLTVPLPDGHQDVRVVAVIDDSVSDGGMLMLSPELYQRVTGSTGIFYVGVQLAEGADAAAVRSQLEALVADRYPRADVLDLAEYRDGVSSVLGRLMSSFTTFAWIMYAIAAVVGTATLASSVAERARPVAVTRLVGGSVAKVRSLLRLEAVATVATAWVVAVPAALVAVPALIGGQSLVSGLVPPTRVPTSMIAVSLPLALVSVLAALAIARRTLSERPLAELIGDE